MKGTGPDNGRRRFLANAAGLGVGMTLGGLLAGCGGGGSSGGNGGTTLPYVPRPLTIPPLLRGTTTAGVVEYDLSMAAGSSELLGGVSTRTLGYNGAVLGPVLRMNKGDQVRIRVRNAIGETSTTHWHGMHVPARMDGNPHQPIADGAVWTAEFQVLNDAATLWYHPHPHGRTGYQVYHGLAGLIIVDDANAGGLGLPSTYGVDDLPLVIQDRRFDENGRLLYMNQRSDRMGMKGDRILVNGRERPYVSVPSGLVRLRILNGSNARMYYLGFEDGRSFQVIASDGGLLAAPVTVTRLLVSPAERYEIVVDLSTDAGRSLWLRSFSGEILPSLQSVGLDALDTGGFDVLRLDVQAGTTSGTVPASLAAIPTLTPTAADRIFTMEVTAGRFTINGKSMDINRIDERVAVNSTEIWQITNNHSMPHPFHIHHARFRILTRDGAAPPAHEQGWKDTVLVKAGETVRVIARFADFADASVPYMYHCHILEHEDDGMMGQFTVE